MESERFSAERGFFRKIACLLGRHRRDRLYIRRIDKRWHSWCVGCGEAMEKTETGWVLSSDPPSPSGLVD